MKKLGMEIERVSNGYVIDLKGNKYVVRSAVELGRKVVSLIEGNEAMEVKK